MRSDFGNRPLRDTRLDRSRFVERPDDVAAIERALDLGFNVALTADRGAGTTSLLEHLETRRPSAHRINAEGARSAGDVMWAAAGTLAPLDPPHDEPVPARAGLEVLKRAADTEIKDGPAELLVDGLDPVVAHELFGRLRDDLWDLPLHWVLALRPEDRPVALMAPANAFFEARHDLRSFTDAEIARLLEGRDEERILTTEQIARISDLARGIPSRALGLARDVALYGGGVLETTEADPYDRVATELGDSAARVLRELDVSGPTGPSDEMLLRRVRLSRPRAYEVFRALERAGYVERSHQPTGRQGRPPAVFASLPRV